MKAARSRARSERAASDPTEIVTGPVLRRGPEDGRGVSVWVETDRPGTITCTVWPIDNMPAGTPAGPSAPPSSTTASRRGFKACTFTVHGHHYATVEVTGLEPGTYTYHLACNGRAVWPLDDDRAPASRFRIWEPNEAFEVAGGSCRQHAPQSTGRTRRLGLDTLRSRRAIPDREPLEVEERHGDGVTPVSDDLGADALAALAADVLEGMRPLPHLLLLTGDQVYADEQHPIIRTALRRRRGRDSMFEGPDVENFEEFTWLYRDTWAHPLIRWLLSSVPSLMVFDDHDVIDDWNISDTWMAEMATNGWWPAYVTSALSSYWIYQHLGNMSAEQRCADELLQRIVGNDDGGHELERAMRPLGIGSDERLEHTWSVAAKIGPVQLLLLDSRNGRVVEPERRSMLSPRDWSLLDRVLAECSSDRQLLLITSVPWLLPEGVHQLERWCSELVTKPRRTARRIGEFLRRAIDLEHWPAFGDSVEALSSRLTEHCQRNPAAPQPIVMSGDVHFAYMAEQPLGPDRTALQVVTSPLRQGDSSRDQVARRMAFTQVFSRAIRGARWASGTRASPSAHSLVTDVWTDNNVASFTLFPPNTDAGPGLRRSVVRLDAAELRDGRLRLRPLAERSISGGREDSQAS